MVRYSGQGRQLITIYDKGRQIIANSIDRNTWSARHIREFVYDRTIFRLHVFIRRSRRHTIILYKT